MFDFLKLEINDRHTPEEEPGLGKVHPTAIDEDGTEGGADRRDIHTREPDRRENQADEEGMEGIDIRVVGLLPTVADRLAGDGRKILGGGVDFEFAAADRALNDLTVEIGRDV